MTDMLVLIYRVRVINQRYLHLFPSRCGKGRDRLRDAPSNSQLQRVLQSFTNDKDVLDEYKKVFAKVEAAKEAANKAMELAIQKRAKAQSLAHNADLAMYKATMLMRIAEATQAGVSAAEVAEHFLN